jgi:hypothetical protein
VSQKFAKELGGLPQRRARESGHPGVFDFPGFRVALAIASLLEMTIELCNGLRRQHARVVRPTLHYTSKMLKKVFLRVTLNEVKGLMYLKRRDSSLRSE